MWRGLRSTEPHWVRAAVGIMGDQAEVEGVAGDVNAGRPWAGAALSVLTLGIYSLIWRDRIKSRDALVRIRGGSCSLQTLAVAPYRVVGCEGLVSC